MDSMRQQCVPQIVRAWYDIVSAYQSSDPEMCCAVLETMRRYISLIGIGLIAKDVFMPLLFELILVKGSSDQPRGAVAGCVLAVASKRMDPQSKLSLLKSLQISRVFALVGKDTDSELLSRIAALLIGYAVEALECYKRLNSEEAKQSAFNLLDEVLPSVFYVTQNSPDVTQLFIRNTLGSAVTSSSDRNIEEVEAALSILYAFGKPLGEGALRSGSGHLSELVPMLLATKFPCHSNRLVVLAYLDTLSRFPNSFRRTHSISPCFLQLP
ncbi:hypothetical protein MLD38_029496 [Melastoma candidum]|uniref:Uncharacterized protein n=1 Tax=Melastoma candidum TaxID=119954 RepID=A0ACB9N6D5_9MYRT|nr:hypothetical protein MLD38_029496 [Melastoma candidum]